MTDSSAVLVSHSAHPEGWRIQKHSTLAQAVAPAWVEPIIPETHTSTFGANTPYSHVQSHLIPIRRKGSRVDFGDCGPPRQAVGKNSLLIAQEAVALCAAADLGPPLEWWRALARSPSSGEMLQDLDLSSLGRQGLAK